MPNKKKVVVTQKPIKKPPRRRAQRGNGRTSTLSVANSGIIASGTVEVTNSTYRGTSGALKFNQSSLATSNIGWLSNFLALWDSYRFIRLEFEWIPAASTMTTGTVAFYFDPDPNAKPPANIQAAGSNYKVCMSQVSRKAKLTCVPQQLNRLAWYNVDGKDGTDTLGNFIWVLTDGNVPNGSGSVSLGQFLVRYTVIGRNPSSGLGPIAYTAPVVAPTLEQDIFDTNQDILQTNKEILAQMQGGSLGGLAGNVQNLTGNVQNITGNVQKVAAMAQNAQTMLFSSKGACNDKSETGYYRVRARTNLPTFYQQAREYARRLRNLVLDHEAAEAVASIVNMAEQVDKAMESVEDTLVAEALDRELGPLAEADEPAEEAIEAREDSAYGSLETASMEEVD